ncbi:MAG: hypothetical protein VX946_10400, partial [Pseudomonadota bacterium]|nr:hypothetical protein [Pseudomonadota bacterium]
RLGPAFFKGRASIGARDPMQSDHPHGAVDTGILSAICRLLPLNHPFEKATCRIRKLIVIVYVKVMQRPTP